MARSRDYKSIRYDSAIDGHCAACSSSNLRQASSNRRSMSRGWLAERTGTTRPRRRRRAVRHMPYLPHRTHQLALRARRGSQQERHRLSAGPQRKPSSSFFSRDARHCVREMLSSMLRNPYKLGGVKSQNGLTSSHRPVLSFGILGVRPND